jgi:glycosyltransferase involved in cell wall biosynthesis
MYPNTNNPNVYQGVFVKEQYESLSNLNDLSVELFILKGKNFFTKYIISIFSIYKILLKRRFDVVHIHYGLSGIFLIFIFLFKNLSVFVLTCHGSDLLNNTPKGKIVRFITIYIASKCDGVIYISDDIKNILHRCSSNIYYLPCGVNMNLFNLSKSKNNYFVFPGAKSNKIKNFSLFENIHNTYNQIFSTSYSYKCLDGLSRYDAAKLIQKSTALIMTSLREGSPQSIKEALACDIPVISSDVGDVSLITKDLPGTYVFSKNENPDNIVQQVQNCIVVSKATTGRRRDRIKDLGLSNDEVRIRLFDIYKQLLKLKFQQN